MTQWEAVIGLEVHVQLNTASKTFSASGTQFGAPPNSLTDPTVLGLPGALPVLNAAAVEAAVKLGLATACTIRRRSRFARKHYFYPDLPKGYQISQYDEPLCEHGVVDFVLAGEPRTVRLTRIHMEEDAGKNTHQAGGSSLVDLNRAGVPLCEIVSEPDIRSSEEAAEYMRAVRQLVRYLGICDGNMEQGSLRCDANISVRPHSDAPFGTRVELKNLNSFKFVQRAIDYEIARQQQLLNSGGTVSQETRLWDAEQGITLSMRGKEEAEDYRYFPDPDLPPLVVTESLIAQTRAALPELPAARRQRFISDYGLAMDDARQLTAEAPLADYFDAAVAAAGLPRAQLIANWVQSELVRELNRDDRDLSESLADCPITPEHLAGLVRLIADETISGKIAKKVFAAMYETGDSSDAIVERQGLVQITDEGAIEQLVREVLEANPTQVAQYLGGKQTVLGFLVGQVMKASRGKANPKLVNELLRQLLSE